VYGNGAYQLLSWEDLGAFQFATGAPVGLLSLNPNDPSNMAVTGVGLSVRALTPAITGLTAVLNFEDLATDTSLIEPPEFFGGVQYVLVHGTQDPLWNGVMQVVNGIPALGVSDPSLLYIPDPNNPSQRTTFYMPTIAQSKLLMATLIDASAMGAMYTGLATMAGAYGQTFLLSNYNVTASRAAANGEFAKTPTLAASGVTTTNWFSYFTYFT